MLRMGWLYLEKEKGKVTNQKYFLVRLLSRGKVKSNYNRIARWNGETFRAQNNKTGRRKGE